MDRHSNWLIFLCLPFFGGCGPLTPWQTVELDRGPTVRTRSLSTALPLTIGDAHCQDSGESFSLNQRSVWLVKSGRLELTSHPFAASSGELGLSGSSVIRTEIGQGTVSHFEQSSSSGRSRRLQLLELTSESKYLKVCPRWSNTSDSYLENAALSALSVVERAHEIHQMHFKPSTPTRLTLRMLPRDQLISRYDGEMVQYSSFTTDNATWSLRSAENGDRETALTFYPQSLEGKDLGLFGSHAVYHLPMAIAHEYGHEVFYAALPSYFQELDENEKDFWDLQHRKVSGWKMQPEWFGHFLGRSAANADAISAINEGFADLFGYVAISHEERDLSAQRCIAHRSPQVDRFSEKEFKRLSESNLTVFLTGSAPESSEPGEMEDDELCGGIPHQDSHVLGSIFAHQLWQQMSLRGLTDAQILAQLSLWLQGMDLLIKEKYFQLGPRALMSESLRGFMTALQGDQPLTVLQCNQLREGLTPFYFEWLEESDEFMKNCT